MSGIQSTIQLFDGATTPLQAMSTALGNVIERFRIMQNVYSAPINANSMRSARTDMEAVTRAATRLRATSSPAITPVDPSGVSEARAEIELTATAVTELGDDIRQTVQAQEEYNRALGESHNIPLPPINELPPVYNRLIPGQEQYNRKLREGQSAGSGLLSVVTKLGLGIGAIAGVKKLVGLSDEMATTNARLNLMNDNLQTTAELQDMIYQAAQRSRGAYQVTADAVSKMGLMAGDAFESTQELVAFVEQLNKQFTISGTDQVGIAAATLQLTQALSSGVLRGDELNSISEQANTVIQSIADYLEVPKGQIKDMAAQGMITAEIVKNAMLSAASETNARFESMPWTWGQVGVRVMNQLYRSSQPLLGFINKLANNWETLEPIVLGVATAVGIYLGYIAAIKVAEIAHNVVQGVSAVLAYAKAKAHLTAGTAFYEETLATHQATAAQYGFNAAMLMCPITWVVVGIIAIITVITALVRHFNVFGAKSTSVFGTLLGLIYVAGAGFQNFGFLVANIALGIWNAIQALAQNMRAAFHASIEGIKGFFYGLLATVGDVIGKIAAALNKLPFVSFDYSGITTMAASYRAKSEAAYNASKTGFTPIVAAFNAGFSTFQYKDYQDAFDKGASKAGGLGGMDGFSGDYAAMDTLGQIAEDAGSTAGNTGAMAEAMGAMEDILEYMVDLAERETVNRFTTAEIVVNQTNNNSISSDLDIDGIMDRWNADLTEILEVAAEGVHA